jgi:hypothetical protein
MLTRHNTISTWALCLMVASCLSSGCESSQGPDDSNVDGERQIDFTDPVVMS